MDFPKQPAEALHRSLRLLGGGGPDEMAIRQAAWVARCVVRGEAAPFAPDDLTALAAGLKTTTFERGAVVFRGGSAPSGGAIDLLDLNQLAKTAGIEAV